MNYSRIRSVCKLVYISKMNVLRQIPEEKREIDKVRKNKAGDSGTLADNPPPAEAAAAQVMHEMEQVLGPQPSTSSDGEKSSSKPQRKNPIVKLIRLLSEEKTRNHTYWNVN